MPLDEFTFQLDDGPILNGDDAAFPFVDIQRVAGLDSAPFRETIRDHEGVDGGFIDAEFETGRDVILEGFAYCDVDAAETYLDSLKANFAPVRESLPFYLKAPGVDQRVVFVKPRGVRYDWTTARRTGVTPIQFLTYAEDPRLYDDNLQVVSIPFGGPATTGFGFDSVYDFFTRSETDGIGTSTSGHVWSILAGAAADFDVNGAELTHTHTATNSNHVSVLPIGQSNCDFTVDVKVDVASASGASIRQAALGRVTDADNYYSGTLLLTTAGNVTLQLEKRVATVLSTIVSAVTVGTGHASGDWWRIRMKVEGTVVSSKAWRTGTAEPGDWQVNISDTSLTTGTNIGMWSRLESGNSNTLPFAITFDRIFQPLGFGFDLGFGAVVPPSGSNVVVGGNRPTPAILEISGPVVDPRIINVTDSKTLDFENIELEASDLLTIDLAAKTVTLNGTINRRNALVTNDWFLFNPGTTFVVFGGGSGSGSLSISYRNAWR